MVSACIKAVGAACEKRWRTVDAEQAGLDSLTADGKELRGRGALGEDGAEREPRDRLGAVGELERGDGLSGRSRWRCRRSGLGSLSLGALGRQEERQQLRTMMSGVT
jgi:hypothetical protein